MWESFYAGITTTGPILAMLIFMSVFAAAIVRSFQHHSAEDERANLPLEDGTCLPSSPPCTQ